MTQTVVEAALDLFQTPAGAVRVFQRMRPDQPELVHAIQRWKQQSAHSGTAFTFSMFAYAMLNNALFPVPMPEIGVRETALIAAEVMVQGEQWVPAFRERLRLPQPLLLEAVMRSSGVAPAPAVAVEFGFRIIRAFELHGPPAQPRALVSIE